MLKRFFMLVTDTAEHNIEAFAMSMSEKVTCKETIGNQLVVKGIEVEVGKVRSS